MTFTTPCARPENDPSDWFIERDGKQYPDDELVTEAEYRAFVVSAEILGEEPPSRQAAEADVLAERLVRRRHAKDKCFVECIFRMHCLSKGEDEDHGTWGGYYSEERRQIARLRAEKIAERARAASSR